MGRKPLPANVKLLTGRHPGVDSGGRKVVPPPAFVRVAPQEPEGLSDRAREEWQRVVPILDRLHLLQPGHRSALIAYCETFATFEMVAERLRERGDPKDARLLLQIGAQLRSWLSEFGLTPSSEAKLKPPEPDEDDSDFD